MKRLMEVLFVLPLILMVSLALSVNPAIAQSTYTGGDNGRTIEVNSGDTFMVKLDENPTTGYSWNMTVGDGLTVVSDKYVPNATGLIGSGGYHTWTIRATKAGTYKVDGIYKRPWEPVTGREQKYSLTLKVTSAGGGTVVPANMTFPSFKRLLDLKPMFAHNLTSFGNVFGHMPGLSIFGDR